MFFIRPAILAFLILPASLHAQTPRVRLPLDGNLTAPPARAW
jgi:hypothetical protein